MQGIQICHYLAKGLTMKEVVAHLNLTNAVVEGRLKNLRRKYKCTTTYQLMGLLGAKGEFKCITVTLKDVQPSVDQNI